MDVIQESKKEKESFLRSTPLYEAKLFGGMIVTIVCLALATSAYVKLEEISSDVFDITDNWKTKPAIHVAIPSSYDDDCPPQYVPISLEKSDFTGIDKGPCGCVSNPLGYTSSAGNCSDEAEPTNYCMSAPARGTIQSESWRQSKICALRGGESAVDWTNGYYRRPYPDKEGNCPESYKRCGNGTDYSRAAVCFPVDTVCPITGLLVVPTGQMPTSEGWEVAATFPDGDYQLLSRREYENELPVVDLELHLTEYSSNAYLIDNYDSDQNKRGPCYLGQQQRFATGKLDISDTFLWMFSVPYPSSCSREDARFILFDRKGMEEHFLENLARQSFCSGAQLLPLDDPNYDSTLDPDYLNSGIECDDSNVDYECSRDANQATYCTDSICRQVVYQNICGQYAQAVRSLDSSDKSFGMYRRSEILWKQTCVVDQNQIYTNIDPLRAALAAQLAGVIVSYLFGITCGICIPVIGLCRNTNKTKLRVNPTVEILLMRVDPFIHLFKLGPIIAAIIFIGQIYRMYSLAGDDECSDPTTNSTFKYLGETLPSIYQTSLANVVLEGLLMMVAIYSLRSTSTETVVPIDEAGNIPANYSNYTPWEQVPNVAPHRKGVVEEPPCIVKCCCCCCLCCLPTPTAPPSGHSQHQAPHYQMVQTTPSGGGVPQYPPPSQPSIHSYPAVGPSSSAYGSPPPSTNSYGYGAPPPSDAPPNQLNDWGAPPSGAPPSLSNNWGAPPSSGGAPPKSAWENQSAVVPVVTASPVPQGELISVVIPFGSPPGSTVQITTPSGTTARFVVPPGAAMGSTIQVRVG